MLRFDARAAKLLQAGDHLTWPEAPGLRLQASATRRAWVYRYKSPVDGRMRQIKLGEWPAMSVGAALVAWEAQRAARDGGADPAAEKRTVRQAQATIAALPPALRLSGRPTIRELCTAFTETYAAGRRKPKGQAELRRLFAKLLGPTGDLVAADLTRTQAFDLIQGCAATPVQAASLRTELGAVWDWALDSGRLPDTAPNWWRLILRGKLKSKGRIIGGQHQGVQKRSLTAAEVASVLTTLGGMSPLVRDLLTLYLWTGCRGAELCAMRGDEITDEPDGTWWTIPKAKLKTARLAGSEDLRVPLLGRSLAIVRRRRAEQGGGWLFPARNAASKLPHVQQKVLEVAVWTRRPSCQSAPELVRARWAVSDWAPHDLRRTVRTQLSRLGCPQDLAEAVLGHMPGGVVGVYDRHRYDAERRLWLGKVVQAWEAFVTMLRAGPAG